MKTIAFPAIKGGVGKTTICFNFGEYLARKLNQRVLFIDMDSQCSLTKTLNDASDNSVFDNESNVGNILAERGGDADIKEVDQNIFAIAGAVDLDNIETMIENSADKNKRLYKWFLDRKQALNDNFDYCLIDCHPDFGTATRNAILVSDAIISPIIPGRYSFDSKDNIEIRLQQFKEEEIQNYETNESFVKAKLFYALNMLQNNTKASREIIETLGSDDNIIAQIPRRELFNHSTMQSKSLTEMEDDKTVLQRNRNFFEKIDDIFLQMKNTIDLLQN